MKGDCGSKPIAHLYSAFHSPVHEYDSENGKLADQAEYEANARLIMAAPETWACTGSLLLVCEDRLADLQEELRLCGFSRDDEDAQEINASIEHYERLKRTAEAVLAKVAGRTTNSERAQP